MDATSLLRTMGALGAVLGLLCLALWATKRYNIRLPGATPANGQRRLAVVERVALDARRSVALIRRDGREHLILMSPEGHHIVESGIEAPPAAAAAIVAANDGDFATVLAATNAAHDRPTITRDASAALAAIVTKVGPLLVTARSRSRQLAAHGLRTAAPHVGNARVRLDSLVARVRARLQPKIAPPLSLPRAMVKHMTTTADRPARTQVTKANLRAAKPAAKRTTFRG